ncbi:MAG: 1-deoxy-D-xylulose-5-phosphate reductoisomerase [Gemmatimonadetes bacterium]|nr:1-deoxy-D-xylulose-5-phosphate reductoisomerase [Gemmatimonadota bacterium]
MKRIAVLGATGSIGRSTLAVARRHPDRFQIVALSALGSVAELESVASEFGVSEVAVADPAALGPLAGRGWRSGPEGVEELARLPEVDIVVNAVVGAAGLVPTIAALEAGKRCALANKESLVAAGGIVLAAAERGGGELVPVDSEHSAIHQCLSGAAPVGAHRLILTASGGPFRQATDEELERVTAASALRHPTWEMGRKITIDSATLANKALEVVEAHHLFGMPYDRIDVVVHPTSIVHSFVEFVDGSVISQMGAPSMEVPILYALTWPRRASDAQLRGFDPVAISPLAFEPVDDRRFPLFRVGVNAGRAGGAAPAVFNAANEVAVEAFLEGRVSFAGMARVVEETLEVHGELPVDTLDDVLGADREARGRARAEIEAIGA